MAISVGSRVVFSSTNPTSGAKMWKATQLQRPLETVSCTRAHLCLLGDDRGDVRTSTDPTAGARSWTFAHLFGKPGYVEDLHAAACGSEHWCLIGAIWGEGESLILATKPTGTTSAPDVWQDTVANSTAGFISGSCVGSFCAYTASDGSVYYYPTRSFRTLTKTKVFRAVHGPEQGSISCVSRNWCAMGTDSGDFYIGRR